MRSLTIILFLLLLGCSSKPSNLAEEAETEQKKNNNSSTVKYSESAHSLSTETKRITKKRRSTPLEPYIKDSLRTLYDSGVFDVIHRQTIQSLERKHTDYFLENSAFLLLSQESGNIFQNDLRDDIFVTFDNTSNMITFIVFDALKREYSILYEHIDVEQGIDSRLCHYGSSGTLDYQLAWEIGMHKDWLLENPETFKENILTIVGTLKDNKYIIEDQGCFANGHEKESSTPSICFTTSFNYNNWECLKYNPEKGFFQIYFGQAFAD